MKTVITVPGLFPCKEKHEILAYIFQYYLAVFIIWSDENVLRIDLVSWKIRKINVLYYANHVTANFLFVHAQAVHHMLGYQQANCCPT